MFYQVIHLKDFFPQLGIESIDPMLTVYLPDNLVEMGRQNQKHSCLLICPGGGYAMCSQREADLIVYHFLPIGIFIWRYILWIYVPKGGYVYADTGKRVGKQLGNPIVKRCT